MENRLTYHWLHTGTNREGESPFTADQCQGSMKIRFQEGIFTLEDRLELIAHWNRLGRGTWVYWL